MIAFEFGPASDDLFRAVLALETVEECERFFRDLCTLSELRALTERWQVVRKLEEGRPYRAISEETGVSTATITRVAHWLQQGEGGYRLALDRLTGE
ncbi:MAG: YerC/YecD family TrpR-related protein [Rubricoccaceae bacterium]|nr:YerC/YecD family TrpR-related protein [Rubricoccaceae bacterium]